MITTTASATGDRTQQRRIQFERNRQLLVLTRFGQPLVAVAAWIFALGLWFAGGPVWLLPWAAAMLAVLGVEAWLWLMYRRADAPRRAQPVWEHRFAGACLAAGMLWSAPALLIGSVSPALEIVIAITLVGVSATTLGAMAVSALAFNAYAMPPLVALAAVYASCGGTEHVTLAALAALVAVFLVSAQQTIARRFVQHVRAQLRSEELLERLTAAESALKESLAEHQLLFDLASVGIAEIRDGRIVRSNAQLEAMLGYAADAMLGQEISVLHPPGAKAGHLDELRDPFARGLALERDVQVARSDGSVLWVALACRAVEPGQPHGTLIAVFSDITDRREREAAMQRLAHEDALTGLPNRRLLMNRLRQALARALRHREGIALLLLDLDDFKRINDEHGHEAGDHVLAEIAQRLLDCVRGSDTVSRIGGDEFVVLLDAPTHVDDACRVAAKLVAAVAEPVHLAGRELKVGTSIGIGMAPYDSADADELMRLADAAMYRAKEAGRNVWRLHRDTLA
ncbi:MAG: diguanylate cyclase [Xanthomonadales bacterium]|nr:diguanylate cyclase [Xanthomonadales bacterium]